MNILVTGGSGLVGRALQEIQKDYIQHRFYFLSSQDVDLTNFQISKEVFSKINPQMVIHLAACVGGLFKNMNYKVDMFEKNMLINLNVLKICHDLGVSKVVSCLSTCIFPDKTSYPINEDMLHQGPPHESNDAYAYAKRMLEIQSMAYQQQYQDNFICVIPTNIYGEYDNYSLEDGHVIPALIHRCYLAKKNKQKFIVRGTGKPLRQFIYSRDLAKLIMWSLLEYQQKESIILSVSEEEERSIGDVAKLIAQHFDYLEHLEFDDSFSDGQYKKTADNSKLRKNHPDFKFTTMDDGLRKSIIWFNDNYPNLRH